MQRRQSQSLPLAPLALLVAFAVSIGAPWSSEVHGEKKSTARIDLAVRRAMRDARQPALRVIVGTKRGREALKDKVQRRGNTVHSDHPSIGSFAVTVSAAHLTMLVNDPDVSSLSIDAVVIRPLASREAASREVASREVASRVAEVGKRQLGKRQVGEWQLGKWQLGKWQVG